MKKKIKQILIEENSTVIKLRKTVLHKLVRLKSPLALLLGDFSNKLLELIHSIILETFPELKNIPSQIEVINKNYGFD
jgi:hypothetical protein